MSLEQTAYVVGASVPDRCALQEAIDSLGFDCKIDQFYVPFNCQGFLPCILNGNASGFEIYFGAAAEMLAHFTNLACEVGDRDVAVSFRWGGDVAECACVLIVSAALADRFGAVVHYQADDIVFSATQLVEEAHAALAELAKS